MRYLTFLVLSVLAGLWVGTGNAENGSAMNPDLTACVQALANARQAAAAQQASLKQDLTGCRDHQAEQEEALSGLVKQNEGCEADREELRGQLTRVKADLIQARMATRACQGLYEQQRKASSKAKVQAEKRIAQLQRELQDAQGAVQRCETARNQSAQELRAQKQQDAERIAQLEAELQDAQAQGKQNRQEANRCQVERDGLQRTLATRNNELDAAQRAIAKSRSERERLQQALSDTRQGLRSCQQEKSQIAALLERTQQGLQDSQGQLAETEGENQQLIQKLSTVRGAHEHCQALYDGLEAKATLVQQAADACRIHSAQQERELDRLRNRLPRSEGGRLSVEDLKSAATQAARTLVQAFKAKHRRAAPAGADAAFEKAQEALANLQFQIARAEGRSGVYRIRPRDTLASIARWYYGRGDAWQRLYGANRYVLDDPDRLIPGTTLIVP